MYSTLLSCCCTRLHITYCILHNNACCGPFKYSGIICALLVPESTAVCCMLHCNDATTLHTELQHRNCAGCCIAALPPCWILYCNVATVLDVLLQCCHCAVSHIAMLPPCSTALQCNVATAASSAAHLCLCTLDHAFKGNFCCHNHAEQTLNYSL